MKLPVRRITRLLADSRAHRAERRRPTGLGLVLADSVNYLNSDHWDAAAASGGFFLGRDFLRVAEKHGPDNVTPRYALIFRGDRPVAAVLAQMVVVGGERVMKSPDAPASKEPRSLLRRAFSRPVRKLGRRLEERVLVCGNLLTWGRHGVAFAPGEDPEPLWPGVAEALFRMRRADKLMGDAGLVVLKDLTSADSPADGAMARFGYRALETEPNMVLELSEGWRTFDDYLGSLVSKHRSGSKAIARKLEEAGVALRPMVDLEPHADALHALYLQVQANATVRPVTVPASFEPALARAAGNRFRCTAAWLGDRPVGFVCTLGDGDTAIGYHLGFDRALAGSGLPLYRALLQATIGDALSLGCRRLSLGRTALEPKAGLGAKPEPMHVWVRHRNPTLNLLVRRVLGLIPHAEAPDRNPFKA